ncbi:hypothetical protein L9F63_027578, partial [Diploptera punctata]
SRQRLKEMLQPLELLKTVLNFSFCVFLIFIDMVREKAHISENRKKSCIEPLILTINSIISSKTNEP